MPSTDGVLGSYVLDFIRLLKNSAIASLVPK